jgi:hypothetical protein
VSTTTPDPHQLPALKPQLVAAFGASILGAVLWTLAAVGAVAGQEQEQPMPLVNLCIGLAASASVIAAKLWLDYHRRLRERTVFGVFVADIEARHEELVAALRDAAHLQEMHHQMLIERIDAIPNDMDQARWRQLAENLRAEFGIPKNNGAKSVIPMHRPAPPSAS